MGVLASKQMGAKRIIAMSRHKKRQDLAQEFGATDIITERGDEGVARIKDMTKGIGADAVLECVGTGQSMAQALKAARPGAMVGYVGVPHGVELDGGQMFYSQVGMLGGPAPVRRFLPDLLDWSWTGRSIQEKCSTWSYPSRTLPKDTKRWTSGGRLRSCCGFSHPAPRRDKVGMFHKTELQECPKVHPPKQPPRP